MVLAIQDAATQITHNIHHKITTTTIFQLYIYKLQYNWVHVLYQPAYRLQGVLVVIS